MGITAAIGGDALLGGVADAAVSGAVIGGVADVGGGLALADAAGAAGAAALGEGALDAAGGLEGAGLDAAISSASGMAAPATTGAAGIAGGAGSAATGLPAWTSPALQAGGQLGSSLINASAARKAANTQAQAAQAAGQQQLAIYDQQQAMMAPWISSGQDALTQLNTGMVQGGQFNKPYTLADFQSGPQNDLYKFAKGEANEAMQNQLNSTGQQMSTNAVQGAGTLAGNLANTYFNTGFSQNMATNQMALGTLESVAGLGQSATGVQNTNLGNLGTSLGNMTLTAGNANAAGQVAQGNAFGAGTSNLFNNMISMNTLNSLFNG